MKCPYHEVGDYLCQKFFSIIELEIHLLDDHKWSIKEVEAHMEEVRGLHRKVIK